MSHVFHFRGCETVVVCGDTVVTLKGRTFDGVEFEASDRICTVPSRCDSISCD